VSFEYSPFRFLRNLARSREIVGVLLRHGFDDLIERIGLRRYLQWGKRLFFRREPAVGALASFEVVLLGRGSHGVQGKWPLPSIYCGIGLRTIEA
jgi:hypothetical protein